MLKSQTDKFLSSTPNASSTTSSGAAPAPSSGSSSSAPSKTSSASVSTASRSGVSTPSKIPVPRDGRERERERDVRAKENADVHERHAQGYGGGGAGGQAQHGSGHGQAAQSWTGYIPTSQQGDRERERERDHAPRSNPSFERVPPGPGAGASARDSIRSPPLPAAPHPADDIHMMTVNPGLIGADTLAALRVLPAHASAQQATEGDVRMQTVHRGVPAELKAALASPMAHKPLPLAQPQQVQPAAPRSKQSYIPTRTAPATPTQTPPAQQVQQPPAQLQLWEREILASAEVKRKATLAQLCECGPVIEGEKGADERVGARCRLPRLLL